MLSMNNCRRYLSKQIISSSVWCRQFTVGKMQQDMVALDIERSLKDLEVMDKISNISKQPLVDKNDGNIFDIVGEMRTEYIYDVEPAQSINNLFSGTNLPQNPWMADNNWNSPHQDSYCSESVGLDGPNGKKLKLVKQYNPFGFVPTMVCNQHNQLIGVSFKDGLFRLITFDTNCNILTSNIVNKISGNSFGGGYFYLDNNNDTIVVNDLLHLACYNTSDKIQKTEDNKIGELELKWKSEHLGKLMESFGIEVNDIYSTLPIWNADGNTYWVLVPGSFNLKDNNTKINPVQIGAVIIALSIKPNSQNLINKCDTKVLDYYYLPNQYINNTLAADEDGVYFVTNQVTDPENLDDLYKCNKGKLIKLKWDNEKMKINPVFESPYDNIGYKKYGMANVGSGTTPTIFKLKDESNDNSTNYIAINDNASPRMNVCVYDSNDGKLLSKVPVFNKMRSADEASFIGVNGRIVVENNFGHDLTNFYRSQYVANEPGMTMIDFNDILKRNDNDNNNNNNNDNIIWDKNDTRIFAMSMLCRESGIIYAYTCDWNVSDSSTKGGMFYISAIDSFDGRTVWRIPIGQGHPNQHSVGGIYFDRNQGNKLFVGSYDYLISIQNFDDE